VQKNKADGSSVDLYQQSISSASTTDDFFVCVEVIIWQCKRNKKFIVASPAQSYLSQFLDQKRWHKVLNTHLRWERVDIQSFATVMMRLTKGRLVYYSSDENTHDVSWFEHLTKKMFFKHEPKMKCPHWKHLPSRFIAALMRGFPGLSQS